MAEINQDLSDTDEPNPNFVLPRYDAITEENWSEHQAQGFVPVVESLKFAQAYYGTENVYTGNKWDADAGKPLRHKPGKTVYVSPAGLKRAAEDPVARHIRWMATGHDDYPPPDDDPATS